MREVQDHYFKLAKKDKYLSRAAYKLIEIDERRKVMRPGDRVLDCGCAPGSWLQVAARSVKPHGAVVGIDLQPITHRFDPIVKVVTGDFTTTRPETLLELAGVPTRLFDVVLSDMAPNTSGDPSSDHFRSVRLCESVIEVCPALLVEGGNLVMKVFEGTGYRDLVKRVEGMFDQARGFKPKASRSESVEMFIVATGFQPGQAKADQHLEDAQSPPKRKPSTGWAPR